jgi:hypothetical protein
MTSKETGSLALFNWTSRRFCSLWNLRCSSFYVLPATPIQVHEKRDYR